MGIRGLVLPFLLIWVAVASTDVAVAQSRRAPAAAPTPAPDDAVEVQVLLDRAGFSSGEIDGRYGRNTDKAFAAYAATRRLTAAPRDEILQALRSEDVPSLVEYTITEQDTAGPFIKNIPVDLMEQAKLPALGYRNVLESLAERFHASPALLQRLNAGTSFTTGARIRVPNVIPMERQVPPGASPDGAAAARSGSASVTITVSKGESSLTATDATGRVVFFAPVTSGSERDPLPLGRWTVTGISRNPVFNYNPDLFWDADPSHAKTKIPAGPNGPVGVVWIDLSKEHYGIHGTPEPSRIGRTTSHGCVRLTNWDAARLAGLVARGTVVAFVD